MLLGEYRGTQVAVKRVIPPKDEKQKGGARDSALRGKSGATNLRNMLDPSSKLPSNEASSASSEVPADPSHSEDHTTSEHNGPSSWAGMGAASGLLSGSRTGKSMRNNTAKPKKGPTYKQLKDEFVKEMRYLSKLRHPCVTTVMGEC